VLVSDSALCEERSGKALSDCLAVNFAVGCTHGCLFCYVDRIHKMSQRVPRGAKWGTYFYVKPGLDEAIRKAPRGQVKQKHSPKLVRPDYAVRRCEDVSRQAAAPVAVYQRSHMWPGGTVLVERAN